MYESAITPPFRETSLLHLGRGMLYAGVLGQVQPHVHAAPVFLAGLYGEFRLCVGDEKWTSCRTAVIPAGVAHELDGRGSPLAVMYPGAQQADWRGLAGLVSQRIDSSACIVGRAGETGLLRDLYEDTQSHGWSGEALDSLFASSVFCRRSRLMDRRLANVVSLLEASPDAQYPIDEMSAAQGLSSSRLMHLFAEQMGTPYRRYRLWCRLQQSMRLVAKGLNLTEAAIAAGFSDSQHYSREFRRAFGIPASSLLRRVARIGLS